MQSMNERTAPLEGGVGVQVRSPLDGSWASGFQVFSVQPSGAYLVRRLSDGLVLPFAFTESELRVDPVPLPAVARSSWSSRGIA